MRSFFFHPIPEQILSFTPLSIQIKAADQSGVFPKNLIPTPGRDWKHSVA